MRFTRMILIVLVLLSWGRAQQPAETEYSAIGQMIYWRTLTTPEKKVFLYTYLYRTHEILKEMRDERTLRHCTPAYQNKILEPLVAIYAQLDSARKNNLIYWIDTFYQSELNHGKDFGAALDYAYAKLQAEQAAEKPLAPQTLTDD